MNQFEPIRDLQQQDHAERARAQRPENSPLRGTSRRSVYIALLISGAVVAIIGYVVFAAEDTATYGSVEELAADLTEGGYECELGELQEQPSFTQGGCDSGAVTLMVFDTSNDLGAVTGDGSIALVGLNWTIVPANEGVDAEEDLRRIEEIVGGELLNADTE